MIGIQRGTVQLLTYRPEWRTLFEEEAARLLSVLGAYILQIEHIGSTAIEGMDAKPIVDIMIAVESWSNAKNLVPTIEALGYEYKEEDAVSERLFFAKGPPTKRTHHLSLTEPTTAYWTDKILFRDYLWEHPLAAKEYRRLKQELAQRYPEDRASYTDGKAEFIRRTLELAKGCGA